MSIDRTAAAAAIDAFLRAIGRDATREPELAGTGARVADAYVDELCKGYAIDTRALLDASTIAGASAKTGLVIVRDLPVATMCPHHLLPASGTATIAMQARDRLVGLGTLASLVDAHARRLTLQEHIGDSVVADLEAVLEPAWVGCRIVLVHGCMVVRGEHAIGSSVETIALRGATGEAVTRAHGRARGRSMIAVVTGGGRGIGRAIATSLAKRGCDIALIGRTIESLAASAEEIVNTGRRVLAVPCDVADGPGMEAAAARIVRDLGVPNIVIPNAGVVHRAPIHTMSEEEWDETIDVNLKGTFLVTRAFLKRMLDLKRGRFVAVASISATLGTAKQSAYCAAKWGTVGFIKSLAEELRGTGLQAMCVMPGSVDTDMLKGSGFAAAMQPEDVANTVTFLALDAPDAMNASSVEVFGP